MLEPLFAGENALEPERVTEKLHQNTFWMGRGGTLTHTISGIDIALWDILGKVTGMPVGRLLGGTYRRRVQPYCSLLMEEPARMRDVVAEYREQRLPRLQDRLGAVRPRARRTRSTRRSCGAAREGVGADAKLFVDAGASDAHWPHGLKWAMRTAEMLTDYDVGWFEEALRPDALDDYCHLRRVSPVPIAGGEVLTRRQAFLPWLSRGAFDIVQPDVTKVGGISEQRRIAWTADDFGVKYVGHGWNTALGRRRRPPARLGLPGDRPRRVHRRQPLRRRHPGRALRPRSPTAIFPSPTAPGSASPSTARSSRASPPILRRCSSKGDGMRSGRIGGPCTAGGDHAA